MIVFDNVTKIYGPQDVLRETSFTVNPGERIGVVGPNGAGKSTIFRLITGEEDIEAGEVIVPGQLSIGYLRQQVPEEVGEIGLLSFVLSGSEDLREMEAELHRLQEQVAASPTPDLLDRLGHLQHEFEHRDGYGLQTRAESALSGLGFAEDRFDDVMGTFSGGWQMRAQLARTLLSRPDILLLDEPSNYLDLPAVEWLQRYLSGYEGTLMLISHDRHLLRTLAKDILEVRQAKVTRYAGGYDKYQVEREARFGQQEARYRTLSKKREEMERFITRFRAQATKAAQVQSRIKMLEKMEPLPVLENDDPAKLIRIPPPPSSGHELIRLEGVGHRYGDDPWIFQDVDLRLEKGDRLALVGYNGMGKSTLLKILAGVMPPTTGKRVMGHNAVPGYQSQEFADTMPPEQSAYRVIRDAAKRNISEQEIRSLLGGFGFRGEDIEKSTGILSGGEKIRLAFARIFVNPPNLLILDEPTTHLDIAGREALEDALKKYQGTVCLVSHDVSFVRTVANCILAVTPAGIQRWPGGYDYFLEKTGGLKALDQAKDSKTAPVGTAKDDPASASSPGLGGKERKEIQKQIRRLESRMSKHEAEIEKLEARQADALAELERGEIKDFATHQKGLNELAGQIQAETREWVILGEELETLQKKIE
ncbi:MAG: ATP-binding cassette domain-containing protein [Verrucomicrobia bacterium]|nr:ATP-binding cassette domain-containing protein [Verrucomicrobiota bacterium]MCH8511588.1 ATP-binding cassette domain-containing protein [Kiritimatiellia bacterium]